MNAMTTHEDDTMSKMRLGFSLLAAAVFGAGLGTALPAFADPPWHHPEWHEWHEHWGDRDWHDWHHWWGGPPVVGVYAAPPPVVYAPPPVYPPPPPVAYAPPPVTYVPPGITLGVHIP
jgi:hypothetical protein